jgi:hypothetical protein
VRRTEQGGRGCAEAARAHRRTIGYAIQTGWIEVKENEEVGMTAADVMCFAAIVIGIAFMAIAAWELRQRRKIEKLIERDLAAMDGMR